MLNAKDQVKKRTAQKDSAIRKKFAPALNIATPSKQAPVGTIAAMAPSIPVIVNENTSVKDVARAMAGNKQDAVLVTTLQDDDRIELCGIVTDKDVAFRCVAANLDPAITRIGQIMTGSPLFVDEEASVDQAMNLMLEGHFRHLPVLRGQQIVGLLDITKILQHIQSKITNSWGTVSKLLEAYDAFQTSWYNFEENDSVVEWIGGLKERMLEPNLSSVVVSGVFAAVSVKCSVRDAAVKMRNARQTAVLVYSSSNGNNVLQGIFTTKDIVLRVLAPSSVDPQNTSIIRVMTPHPDFAVADSTVNEALGKMYRGRYLHLPVLSHLPVGEVLMTDVVGCVDVLSLGYRVVEGLLEQQRPSPMMTDDNPVWSRFWEDDVPAAKSSSLSRRDSSCTTVIAADSCTYKFTDPFTKQKCRFTSNVGEYDLFLVELFAKLKCSQVVGDGTVQTLQVEKNGRMYEMFISYSDDEQDVVGICSQNDFVAAIQNTHRLQLNVSVKSADDGMEADDEREIMLPVQDKTAIYIAAAGVLVGVLGIGVAIASKFK